MISQKSRAAKSLQPCPTLCDPIEGLPPGSPVPGILQARILEWVAISFSSAWKWKVKVKSLSCVQLLATPWIAAYQAPPSMGFFQARVLEWGAIAFSINVARTSKAVLNNSWESGHPCPVHSLRENAFISSPQVALVIKNLLSNAGDVREMQVWFLGWEDPLEEGMAAARVFLPGEYHG